MKLGYLKSQVNKCKPIQSVYTYNTNGLELIYLKGQLYKINLLETDIIDWDGVKHDIPFYEDEIDSKLFKKVNGKH